MSVSEKLMGKVMVSKRETGWQGHDDMRVIIPWTAFIPIWDLVSQKHFCWMECGRE